MVELYEGQVLAGRFALEKSLSELPAADKPPVWLARDMQRGDAPVVLKIAAAHSGFAAAMLSHEFDAASRVRHPAIQEIERLETDGLVVLRSAYAADGSLARLCATAGSDGGELARQITLLLPVVDALATLHDRGLVHRDVKPSNILIDHGSACLADFGIASTVTPGADGYLTSGGSPWSMSPQQYRGLPPAPADDLYGLGATLHELVSGQPPFFPAFTEQKLLEEAPPTLADAALCPSALAELIDQLLAKKPVQRPADMRDVHGRLTRIAATLGNTTAAPALAGVIDTGAPASDRESYESVEAINPRLWQAHDTPADAPGAAAGASASPRSGVAITPGLVAAALAGLLVLAIVMFVVVPRAVGPVDTSGITLDRGVQAPEGTELGPYEFARMQRDRDVVRGIIDELVALQTELEERRVELWAPGRYDRLLELARTGDAQFRAQEFTQAEVTYQEAVALAEELVPLADTAYEGHVEAAWVAYEEGDQAGALARFDQALEIFPNESDSVAGRARAEVLDEVLAALGAARAFEASGKTSAAVEQYNRIRELDPQRPEAGEALARIQNARNSAAFDRAMSDGFAAMQAGRHEEARTLFRRARSLRPNSTAPGDALLQLESRIGTSQVNSARAGAEQLERQENWEEAVSAYQAILDGDSSLSFAQAGLLRAQSMISLNAELDKLIGEPLKLSLDQVYARSGELLADRDTYPNGPLLAAKLDELSTLRAASRVPVEVTLQSDNLTEVTLFRTGVLGRFESRAVTLKPGEYTAVGTRAGFRDVRREFTVIGGRPVTPVDIRCEEPI